MANQLVPRPHPQTSGGTPQPQGTPAFFPGQKGLLSQQLSWGFGRSPEHWANVLGNTYSPLQPIQPYKYADVPPTDTGGGSGKPNDPGKPGKPDGGKDNTPDLPPGYPWNDHSALPAMTSFSALGQNQMPQMPMPTMQQYQQPQQMQMPQQMMGQQQMGLMGLNPQVLAYLRGFGGR